MKKPIPLILISLFVLWTADLSLCQERDAEGFSDLDRYIEKRLVKIDLVGMKDYCN